MSARDKEVKKMRAVSDGDDPGKLRIRVSEKGPVAFRAKVLALGLHGNGGKKFVSPRTRRIIGEFALEAGDQTRDRFCILWQTCSKFHVMPNETQDQRP